MKVIVIGGGPAGMMAAISAREGNDEVTILEKMDSLRKKTANNRKRKMQYYKCDRYGRLFK